MSHKEKLIGCVTQSNKGSNPNSSIGVIVRQWYCRSKRLTPIELNNEDQTLMRLLLELIILSRYFSILLNRMFSITNSAEDSVFSTVRCHIQYTYTLIRTSLHIRSSNLSAGNVICRRLNGCWQTALLSVKPAITDWECGGWLKTPRIHREYFKMQSWVQLTSYSWISTSGFK